MRRHRNLGGGASVSWLLALCSLLVACGSDPKGIDFGAGVDPNKPAPRGRPYPCPPDVPAPQSICTMRDLSCEYAKGTCVCNADIPGVFGSFAWNCAFETATQACPATQPEVGTACTSLLGAADCSYGRQTACRCSSEAQAWACWDPADCPDDRPDGESECDPIGMSCRYGGKSCECFSSGWTCADAI